MSSNPWDRVASEGILDKLKAEDISTEQVILTVQRASMKTIFAKVTGEVIDEYFSVEFAEFPKKELRCSKTQAASFRALAASGKLPNNFNAVDASFDWEGLSIPMHKKNVDFTEPGTKEVQTFVKLFAVAPGGFDKALVDFPRISDKAPVRRAASGAKVKVQGRAGRGRSGK